MVETTPPTLCPSHSEASRSMMSVCFALPRISTGRSTTTLSPGAIPTRSCPVIEIPPMVSPLVTLAATRVKVTRARV